MGGRCPYLQNVLPEAAFPFCLVEEVVKVTAKSDENKPKGQEAKDPCNDCEKQGVKEMD